MSWLAPAIGFVIAMGAIGVTSKLALRSFQWQDLVVWTALTYLAAAITVVLAGQGGLRWVSDTPWAIVSGMLPAIGLVMFFVAVEAADASRVVPVTSVYPVVTVLLAWLLLGETITTGQAVGLLLVISGLAILTR
jgi:bacterial/archaeal transporter family protein